jgi:hypothetical protein
VITEREWLEREAAWASRLTDQDRIRILRDLLRTVEAVRRTKSIEQLQREEEVRRILEDTPGRARYLEFCDRFV